MARALECSHSGLCAHGLVGKSPYQPPLSGEGRQEDLGRGESPPPPSVLLGRGRQLCPHKSRVPAQETWDVNTTSGRGILGSAGA